MVKRFGEKAILQSSHKSISGYKVIVNRTKIWGAVAFWTILLWAGFIVAAPLELFVSISPQKYLVDRLGGELVRSHVLVGQGQSPHMFQPSSKQIMQLSRAKLFFTIDMEFEHILVKKLKESMSSLQLVNSVRSIAKIPMQDHHHGGDLHHGDEQKHAIMDPHVWLSPKNLIVMANNMTEALLVVDPQNAQNYEGNLQILTLELETLDKEIGNMLEPFAGEYFYVFHPSFGYFAHSYHLHQEAVEVAGKSPTPKQLSSLIRKAKEEQVKVIFVQEQFDPRSCVAVARAINGEVVALNPLAENVVGNLRTMASKIRAGLRR